MLSLPVWLLAAFLTVRLTRLVTDDKLSLPVRRRLLPVRGLVDFLECPWCTSVWLGGGVYVFAGLATTTPMTWFAAISSVAAWSFAAGVAGTLLERLDQHPPPAAGAARHEPGCPLAGDTEGGDGTTEATR